MYEGVVRGPSVGDSTASEMQFVVSWTPINMDGSIKGGEPIEEETENESEVVKAHDCYIRWWSREQQKSLNEKPAGGGVDMEVEYSEKEEEDGGVANEDDDDGDGQCVEYFTEIDNETPEMIAVKFGVDVTDILDINKERFKRKLKTTSKFFLNTLLWIPVQMEEGEDVQAEQDTQCGDGEPEAATVAPEMAAVEEAAAVEDDTQAEQDTQCGDGGAEAATVESEAAAAAEEEEEEDTRAEQDTQLGDDGPEAAAVEEDTQAEQDMQRGDGEPEAATVAPEMAAVDKDKGKKECEEEQVAAAVPAKRLSGVRSFAPPFAMWRFRSKRRGASASATCGAIDVYLYPPGETKPLTSKIGMIKWIGQNKGNVTPNMDEGVVAAMWAAARGACDHADTVPSVLGVT